MPLNGQLERDAMKRLPEECPDVEWLSSYAVLGPGDYLDVFIANDIEALARAKSSGRFRIRPIPSVGPARAQLIKVTVYSLHSLDLDQSLSGSATGKGDWLI
jgi:hypothetical protein